jgi:hypothetical protein
MLIIDLLECHDQNLSAIVATDSLKITELFSVTILCHSANKDAEVLAPYGAYWPVKAKY